MCCAETNHTPFIVMVVMSFLPSHVVHYRLYDTDRLKRLLRKLNKFTSPILLRKLCGIAVFIRVLTNICNIITGSNTRHGAQLLCRCRIEWFCYPSLCNNSIDNEFYPPQIFTSDMIEFAGICVRVLKEHNILKQQKKE